MKLQLRRGRCPVNLPLAAFGLAGRVHRDSALQMAVARLILFIEVQKSRGRSQAAAGLRGEREAVSCIQPHRRSIVAEENLRVPGESLSAFVIGCCGMEPADAAVAVKLRVLGVNANRLAPRRAANSTAWSSTSSPCCESKVAPIELPLPCTMEKSTCWVVVATPLFWLKVSPLVLT